MSQERWWNLQDDDSTFRLNSRELGIIPFGRYSGFNPFPMPASLDLSLSHDVDGVTKIKQDLSETPALGIWKSKQGVVIQEDAAIVIPIAAGDPTYARIDLIVGRHKYIATVGGAAATYAVIQGTPSATPVAPALTVPAEQVILGRITVPAGMTVLNGAGVTYVREPNPLSDPFAARVNTNNNFTQWNTFGGTVTNGIKDITVNNSGVGSNFTVIDGNIMRVTAMGASGVGVLEVRGLALLPPNTIIYLDFTATGLTNEHFILRNNAVAVSGSVLPLLTSNAGDLTIWKGGVVAMRATAVGYQVIGVNYAKKYYDGYEVLVDGQYSNITKKLTVKNKSRSFTVSVPSADYLNDIDVVDDYGNAVTVATGTIINVRFKHIGGPIDIAAVIPFKINLRDSGTVSNIRSNVSDLNALGGTALKTLNIIDDTYYGSDGDIIAFRKTDTVWDIVSANREAYYARVLQDSKVSKGIIWVDEGTRTVGAGLGSGEAGQPRVRHCVHPTGLLIVEINVLAASAIAANTNLFDLVVQIPEAREATWRKSMPFVMIQNAGAGRTLGAMNFKPSVHDFTLGNTASGKSMYIVNATAIPAGYAVQETFILTI